MGGKRGAQPSGDSHGKAVASGDGAAAQGGASWKRKTRELSVDGAAAGSAEGRSCGQEESGSTLGPSEDTLHRVLPLVLARLEPEGVVQLFQVCKPLPSLPPFLDAPLPSLPLMACPAHVLCWSG